MPPEKRNQFLDAGDSDDEGSQGYDSEAGEVTKGGRSAKRRKVDKDSDEEDLGIGALDEELSGSEDGDVEEESHVVGPGDNHKKSSKHDKPSFSDSGGDDEEADDLSAHPATGSKDKTSKPKSRNADKLSGVSKALSKKNLLASEKAIARSGVIYISRVPPYLTPQKLRSLLIPYGELNRIFLSPETETMRSRRIRGGGNKKKSFTDGWVEFVRKRDAKRAVDLLNAHTIGGKKGSWYRDDIWSLRYLKGFKWNHLTEQISAENAARASRMRAEISKTEKENMEFKQSVLRAKEMEGMETKRATKRKRDGAEDAEEVERHVREEPRVKKGPLRTFKQTSVAVKGKEKAGSQGGPSDDISSLVF